MLCLTISQCTERFACDVKSSEGGALSLSGPPTGQRCLQGWGPVTDHSQRLPFHRDDLTALRLGYVGVWLGHCERDNRTLLGMLQMNEIDYGDHPDKIQSTHQWLTYTVHQFH